MAMFDRKFGVELEVSTSLGAAVVARIINEAGVQCRYAGYTHATSSNWKVVTDASIVGPGCEVVSPILTGEDGLQEVARVCDILKAAGCVVNRSCGFHVHVDARDVEVAAIRKLTVNYIDFEGVVDSLLPPTRRGSANSYCRSITHVSKSAIAAANSVQAVARNFGGRFVKLNLESFWRHGTVEFRHHSGTVEAQKAVNWVKFCLRMVDAAVADPIINVVSTPALSTPILNSEASRRATFVRLLLRPEGATRDEIFSATGWRRGSLSMRRFANEAGLELSSRRSFGRVRRYYGRLRGAQVSQVAAPATPATLVSLFDLLGMDDSERTYWTGRRDLFANAVARRSVAA